MTRDEAAGWDSARTLALLLCAGVWVLVGLGVLLAAAGANPYVPHTQIPAPLRVSMWFGPAAFAVLTCVTRRWAGLTVALLIIGPVIRVLSYLFGWAVHLLHLGPGHPTGWYAAALHLALVGLVVLAAILTRDDKAGA